jgi:hypothetical protein
LLAKSGPIFEKWLLKPSAISSELVKLSSFTFSSFTTVCLFCLPNIKVVYTFPSLFRIKSLTSNLFWHSLTLYLCTSQIQPRSAPPPPPPPPPPPGNPREFDLTLPPYRREFDGPVGNLTAGLAAFDNLTTTCSAVFPKNMCTF